MTSGIPLFTSTFTLLIRVTKSLLNLDHKTWYKGLKGLGSLDCNQSQARGCLHLSQLPKMGVQRNRCSLDILGGKPLFDPTLHQSHRSSRSPGRRALLLGRLWADLAWKYLCNRVKVC